MTNTKNFPKNWRKVKLVDITNIVYGRDFPVRSLRPKGFPVYGGNGLIGYGNRYLYEKPQIIVGCRGAYSGNVFKTKPKSFITHNSLVLQIRENRMVDKNFLFYSLKKLNVKSTITGSAQPQITIKELNLLELSLPEPSEQKRIASILSAFDDKIELNNKINQTLEEMASAIFKEWFVDFKFPGHKKVRFVDSELGKIPEGWKVKRIKNLGKVVTGKTPSTKDSENFGSKYPFITIPDMSNTFVLIPERYLSENGIQNMRNLLLPAGSICVSCIATVGLVSITTEESVTNQQINSIIPFKKEYKYFLYQFFRKSGRMLKAYGAGGSTTLIVNKSEFEQIKILLADWPTLGNYHKQVAPLYRKILLIIQENQRLAKMRDLLLPKLMRGEIRV